MESYVVTTDMAIHSHEPSNRYCDSCKRAQMLSPQLSQYICHSTDTVTNIYYVLCAHNSYGNIASIQQAPWIQNPNPMNLASGWSIHVHCLDPDCCRFRCPTYINHVGKGEFLGGNELFSSFSRAGAHNDAISEQWWLHTITETIGFWQISQFRDKGINGFILCLVTRIKDVSFVCLIKFSDYDLLQFLQDEADWFLSQSPGIRLNKEKIQLHHKSIPFLGHLITDEGLPPFEITIPFEYYISWRSFLSSPFFLDRNSALTPAECNEYVVFDDEIVNGSEFIVRTILLNHIQWIFWHGTTNCFTGHLRLK